nr:MAG TPA: hypothetical protein [Caudoviricetes sp.]
MCVGRSKKVPCWNRGLYINTFGNIYTVKL